MNRVVVVLPLTPVTATMGIRPISPRGKRISAIASPTGREMPTDGSRCIRKPGAALTSTMMPPCSLNGREMSWATTSMPAMSRPTILAASTALAATAGCTRSVTSMAVPPVLRFALRRISTVAPAGGIDAGV